MSDLEVIDMVGLVDKPGACFGQYDKSFNECANECQIRQKCKEKTKQAPKPVTPVEEAADGLGDGVEEFAEMNPRDFLVESLKGRYEVMVKDTPKGYMVAGRRNGKMAVKVMIIPSGKVLIEVVENGAKLQLPALESPRQVLGIVKALLIG